ncbi:MAG: ATP-binding protein [Campylobacteraceae bacterium]|nr:ATP-binding protein [Campylobacteraceae bacterium]
MKKFTSNMTITSNLKNIKRVMTWIEADLKSFFKNEKKYQSIILGLQEAITNAIIHGNKLNEKKFVNIYYCLDKKLKITIEDEGKGILAENQALDISKIKKEDIYKESKRGIMLMKHFCDEVIFNKNSVTLVMQYE